MLEKGIFGTATKLALRGSITEQRILNNKQLPKDKGELTLLHILF